MFLASQDDSRVCVPCVVCEAWHAYASSYAYILIYIYIYMCMCVPPVCIPMPLCVYAMHVCACVYVCLPACVGVVYQCYAMPRPYAESVCPCMGVLCGGVLPLPLCGGAICCPCVWGCYMGVLCGGSTMEIIDPRPYAQMRIGACVWGVLCVGMYK